MRIVVGAAIVSDGRLLVARRRKPPAGRWELPGGKTEPGESAEEALVREVREELGCTVEVTGWLPGEERIDDRLRLRVGAALLVHGRPEPRDHDELRWLTAATLEDVDWLDPDRPFLPGLRRLLDGGANYPGRP